MHSVASTFKGVPDGSILNRILQKPFFLTLRGITGYAIFSGRGGALTIADGAAQPLTNGSDLIVEASSSFTCDLGKSVIFIAGVDCSKPEFLKSDVARFKLFVAKDFDWSEFLYRGCSPRNSSDLEKSSSNLQGVLQDLVYD